MTARILKQCRECKAFKARDRRNFYRSGARDKDGYMGVCIPCHAAYNAARKELKREIVLAKQRIYDALPHRKLARDRYRKSDRGREAARRASLVYSRYKRMMLKQANL